MTASKLLFTFAPRTSILPSLTKRMSASKRLKLSNMAPSPQSTGSGIVRFYDPDVQAKDALGRTHEQILAWSDNQLEHSHNYIQVLFPLPEGSPFNRSAPVIDLETVKAFRANSELRQQLRRSFERMLTFYGFAISSDTDLAAPGENHVEKEDKTSTTKAPSTTRETTENYTQGGTGDTKAPPDATEGATTSQDQENAATRASSAAEAVSSKSSSQGSPIYFYVVRGDNWRKASRNWCVRSDHNHLRITRILRCLRVLGLQKESDAFFAALKHVFDDPATGIGARSMEFWTRAAERPLYLPPDDMEDECDWLKAYEEEQQSKG